MDFTLFSFFLSNWDALLLHGVPYEKRKSPICNSSVCVVELSERASVLQRFFSLRAGWLNLRREFFFRGCGRQRRKDKETIEHGHESSFLGIGNANGILRCFTVWFDFCSFDC